NLDVNLDGPWPSTVFPWPSIFYPPRVEAELVLRRNGRAAEPVPVRHAERREVELRDDVVAEEQHTVERARACDQRRAVGRRDDLRDQLVHDRIADAREVTAARRARRLAAPEVRLLVPGGQRLRPE